jgi:hypothetical protein
MTFSQYQQLVAAAKKQIAEKVAAIQPRGGNQVSVIGDGIAVEVIDRGEDEEPPPETWEYYIYGTIKLVGGETILEDHEAARIARPSGFIAASGFFEQETEVSNAGVPPVLRVKKVTYYVTTLELRPQGFDNGVYRGGLRLTCEFFQVGQTDAEDVVIREYTLNVGRNGDSVTLTPPEENEFYRLRIKSVERL